MMASMARFKVSIPDTNTSTGIVCSSVTFARGLIVIRPLLRASADSFGLVFELFMFRKLKAWGQKNTDKKKYYFVGVSGFKKGYFGRFIPKDRRTVRLPFQS